MNHTLDIGYLEQVIASQRVALRFRLIWAALMVIGGVAIFVFSPARAEALFPGNLDALLRIGGIFFGGLSAFPLKDVFEKRGFIGALEYLRRKFKELQAIGDQAEPSAVQSLKERFEKLLDQQLGLEG